MKFTESYTIFQLIYGSKRITPQGIVRMIGITVRVYSSANNKQFLILSIQSQFYDDPNF